MVLTLLLVSLSPVGCGERENGEEMVWRGQPEEFRIPEEMKPMEDDRSRIAVTKLAIDDGSVKRQGMGCKHVSM